MHADPELLSLLALGEHVGTEDERAHVQTCPECARELSDLQRVTTLARSIGPDSSMITPSPAVWSRIQSELGFVSDSKVTADRPTVAPLSTPPEPDVAASPPTTSTAPRPRRLLAAITAALARASRGANRQVTARAALKPVDVTWSRASGTAEIATDELGRRVLTVALDADLPTSGVRQAWLVHRDDPSVRQSLGVLDGPHGLWTVEHLIDLQQYSILDISQQGTGETQHSGQTIVRGDLTLVG